MATRSRTAGLGLRQPTDKLVGQAPQTPTKGKSAVNEFLDGIRRDYQIVLPISEKQSPSKRPNTVGHGVVKKLSFLYFADNEALNELMEELRTCLPTLPILGDHRLSLLDQKVRDKVDQAKKRRTPLLSKRKLDSATEPWARETTTDFDAFPGAPPSPTLAVRNAPTQMPELDVPDVPTLVPIISATTSANTSFVNTSFMSDLSKVSDFTTATSVSGAPDATQKSESYGSSFPPGSCERLERQAANDAAEWAAVDGGHLVELAVDTPIKAVSFPNEEVCAGLGKPKEVAEQSPSKSEHHRVKSIPAHGLSSIDLPDSMHFADIGLAAAAYRLMRACDSTQEKFDHEWPENRSPETLLKLLRDLKRKGGVTTSFLRGFKTDYTDSSLCGKLRINKNGPLFGLELLPPRPEGSTAYQRKFGFDRFLFVDFPAMTSTKLPTELKGQDILRRVSEMLAMEQSFLGRKWVRFHIQDKKGKKMVQDLETDEPGSVQVTFFAVSGPGLKHVRISELVSWAVPLSLNSEQPAGKALARLGLPASRTGAALVFEYSRMHFVSDLFATNDPDDYTFDDLNARRPDGFDPNKRLDMTDGCGEMSSRQADRYSSFLGCPTCLRYSKVWIKSTKTQRKVKYSREEMQNDPHLRTFNVVNWSRPAKPSMLYTSFWPILQACGVPKKDILAVGREQLELETNEFLAAITDRVALYRWIHKLKDMVGTRVQKGGIPLQAGFPTATDERIVQLLESGFDPSRCSYLSKEVLDAGQYVFTLEQKRCRLRLPQSTTLIGIPDWTRTLKPGEICVSFSRRFTDPITGQSRINLNGEEVLITRNPALRNSDMQKVRVVCPPQLQHLVDVVVFSTKGPRPLASKLSGGDYDGDSFWVSWEPRLVKPFKNATAPWETRSLKHFNITKDLSKLGTIVTAEAPSTDAQKDRRDQQVLAWLREYSDLLMGTKLLGAVTLHHEALTNDENSITSEKADMLVDLHDLLVDAPKQGLRYEKPDWERFLRQNNIPVFLPEAAHRKFTGRKSKEGETEEAPKPNPENIIDNMYFDVIKPRVDQTMRDAKQKMRYAQVRDDELAVTFRSRVERHSGNVQEVLRRLNVDLQKLKDVWAHRVQKYVRDGRKRADWDDLVLTCREVYDAIQPSNLELDIVTDWLIRIGSSPTHWEEIKASALSQLRTTTDRLMFTVAGGEICHLKLLMANQKRSMLQDVYLSLKPHKRDMLVDVADGFDEDDEHNADSDMDDDEFPENESTFEGIDVSPEKVGRFAAVVVGDSSVGPSRSIKKQRISSDLASTPSSDRRKKTHTPDSRRSKNPQSPTLVSDEPENYMLGSPPPNRVIGPSRPSWLQGR